MKRTRSSHAVELRRLLTRGPAFSFAVFGVDGARDMTPEVRHAVQVAVEAATRGWLQTWVLPEVAALVPEFKDWRS